MREDGAQGGGLSKRGRKFAEEIVQHTPHTSTSASAGAKQGGGKQGGGKGGQGKHGKGKDGGGKRGINELEAETDGYQEDGYTDEVSYLDICVLDPAEDVVIRRWVRHAAAGPIPCP